MPSLRRPSPTQDRPARRRAGRVMAAAAQAIGIPAASVVVSALAVRSAGVETWGAFVATMIVVQLVAQVVDLGSRDALLRQFSRRPGAMTEDWRLAAGSRLPILVIAPVLFLALGNDLDALPLLCIWVSALVVARLHDGVVAYRRAFSFALGVELAAISLTLAGVLLVGADADVRSLTLVFTVAACVRAGAMIVRLPMLRPGPGWRWSPAELRRSWPFFALTFSGAVQSRVDLYVVAALLPAPALGAYQVLTGMVLVGQSLAGALVGPVAPALYRLHAAATRRLVGRLAVRGLLVASVCAAGIAVVTPRLFGIAVPPEVVVVAWLAMLPVWAYLPLVHLAFRADEERIVLVANLVGIAVAGVGALLLVPPLGLTGALGAAALAQVAIMAVHLGRARRRGLAVSPGGPGSATESHGALSDV